MSPTASRQPLLLCLLVAGVLTVVLLRLFDPNQPGSPFPRCLFSALTHMYCAGCGLTRAAHALVHGDIGRALAMNAYAVLSAPLLALMLLQHAGWLPTTLQRPLAPLRSPWFWLVGILLFSIVRNLPWYPFNLLAPG